MKYHDGQRGAVWVWVLVVWREWKSGKKDPDGNPIHAVFVGAGFDYW